VAVRVERDGAVSTVILDHPERRNAVDGPTAAALADAFRDFDAAMANEFARGMSTLAGQDSAEGVARFRRGDGRDGALS
jgi:enoyl-CoA hydratase